MNIQAPKLYSLSFNPYTTIAAALTRYVGHSYVAATEQQGSVLIPFNMTLQKLFVFTYGTPGAGQSFIYDLMHNAGVVAGTTITLADAQNQGAVDFSLPVVEGDRISVRIVTSATATAAYHKLCVKGLI